MAGHSKWANIKHRKGAQDKKRSKIFTRCLKEISIAVKEGGEDPDANPRLRLAILSAKKANIPKDKIEKAISKGSGADGTSYEPVTFEGYAPNGVAVYVECLTDNNNRTVANIRMYFNKYNGSLGTSGSVSYMFDRKGVFVVSAEGLDEEEFIFDLVEAGVEDVEQEEGNFIITCPFENYGAVNAKLEEMEIETESAELEWIPANTITLDLPQAQSVMRLIDTIEEDDDVQAVFHNLELTEEIAESL
jgi:YebC/PmpR family DNA-binding regulatory protein